MVSSSSASSVAPRTLSSVSKGKESVKSSIVGSSTKASMPAASRNGVDDDDDEDLLIGSSSTVPSAPEGAAGINGGMDLDDGEAGSAAAESGSSSRPSFAPLSRTQQSAASSSSSSSSKQSQLRRIPIPPHRLTPLKSDWPKLYTPLVDVAHLQVRMNVPRKCVEIRSSPHTPDVGLVQKGADMLRAYALGFEADDAVALLRLDDVFIDTFQIKDVKTLQGDHLSRAIGRLAGKDGRTRYAIENATRTRIVLADDRIHILGGFQAIRTARNACVSLVLGSPPGKVYAHVSLSEPTIPKDA
ncbi:hypothetical protein BDZ90DRAFT_70405 [Jaminaea rosea]|uniref:Pre-rRNA-processing protein PNO1 n=1 Tax=Jaminaea rosea TaxID=1569628 RepID=A0A316UK28_9BASI|nr:hypothetical protein BDZ90DRAFT_70405 [Jaminaea rosea]PWN25652.1 hypothetical protein BDZ90DRAFT_70405 [Jaminaea rosea]